MTESMFSDLCLTVIICTIVICSYLKARINNKEDNDNE
jgi:hypothetical protein